LSEPGRPTAVVWLIDASQVDALGLEHCCKALGPGESARLARFIRPERRTQYVLGRMLLRQAVSHFTGLLATDIAVIEHEGNSPMLKLPAPCISPSFSISHSAQWIACAASRDAPLGLDIEATNRERDVPGATEAAFSVHERQYVMEAEGKERLARFYRVWTTKEALFKLEHSQGRNTALSEVANRSGMLGAGDAWWSTVLAHPHLCITLCAAVALCDVQLRIVAPGELASG
jgi:4'-phosphopantetheinyl transferase